MNLAESLSRRTLGVPPRRSRGNLAVASIARDSLWLIVSSGAGMFLSFLFWIVLSRNSSSDTVGVSGSLLSLSIFLSGLGGLGLWTGLVRFLHRFKSDIRAVNHYIRLGFAIAYGVALIAQLVLWHWSDFAEYNLTIWSSLILFPTITGLGTANLLLDSALLAMGSSFYLTIRNVASGAVRVLPVVIWSGEPNWILGVWVTGSIVSLVIGEMVLFAKGKRHDTDKLDDHSEGALRKEVLSYSVRSYVGSFVWGIPQGLFPILVTTRLGSVSAAHYFIATAIGSIVVTVIQATSTSAFNRAAKMEKVDIGLFRRVALIEVLFSSSGFVLAFFLGRDVLAIFGHEYSKESITPLLVLMGSYMFLSLISVNGTILMVEGRVGTVSLALSITSAVIVSSGLILMPSLGIMGVALGYFFGYSFGCLLLLLLVNRYRRQGDARIPSQRERALEVGPQR